MGSGRRDWGILEEVPYPSECGGCFYTGGEGAERRDCTCKVGIGAWRGRCGRRSVQGEQYCLRVRNGGDYDGIQVFMSQAAFHALEDRLRAADVDEQKRNRLRDAEVEAGLDVRQGNAGDPYAPYLSPSVAGGEDAGFGNTYGDQAPLVGRGSSFHREYKDDVDEDKSMRSDDFDYRSRLTSDRDDSNSNYGTESYAPSRNMFQTADKEGHVPKETLLGEILEGETIETVRETSARRRWVLLCWLLTWWIPSPFLKWFGRMKRQDVRQAWREKLALNMIISGSYALVLYL